MEMKNAQVFKEIIINAPRKRVWEVFSELEKWPEWSNYALKTYWTSEKKWALGSRFVQLLKGVFFLKKLKSNPTIIEIKPAAYVTWIGSRVVIKGKHTLIFEDAGSKTRVINKESFTGILAIFIVPFIKKRFNYHFEQFLIGLKKKCEG
ncbi:SRPBCC family protein [Candidatus Woesearchaeota archaeon]|nr:SRPBCC family protein [Candidatus Woesearchaeota archaeon]